MGMQQGGREKSQLLAQNSCQQGAGREWESSKGLPRGQCSTRSVIKMERSAESSEVWRPAFPRHGQGLRL